MILGAIGFKRQNSYAQNLLFNIFNKFQKLNWGNATFEQIDLSYFVCSYSVYTKKNKESIYYVDKENGAIILVDGNIFNSLEICAELNIKPNISQPKLIGKAFFYWGPTFAQKLNGAFSIIIYKKKEKELLFFRDHIGI